jgi:hypothetical protein
MIKRRTEVVAGISNEQWKLYRDVFKSLKTEHSLSCIPLSYNVVIDPVGLTLYKLLHQVINTLEVFVCSAEFEKRAIERVHLLTSVTEAVIDARLKISYSRAERLEGKADRKERRESRENRKKYHCVDWQACKRLKSAFDGIVAQSDRRWRSHATSHRDGEEREDKTQTGCSLIYT